MSSGALLDIPEDALLIVPGDFSTGWAEKIVLGYLNITDDIAVADLSVFLVIRIAPPHRPFPGGLFQPGAAFVAIKFMENHSDGDRDGKVFHRQLLSCLVVSSSVENSVCMEAVLL